MGGSNLAYAHSNYLICIQINTVLIFETMSIIIYVAVRKGRNRVIALPVRQCSSSIVSIGHDVDHLV